MQEYVYFANAFGIIEVDVQVEHRGEIAEFRKIGAGAKADLGFFGRNEVGPSTHFHHDQVGAQFLTEKTRALVILVAAGFEENRELHFPSRPPPFVLGRKRFILEVLVEHREGHLGVIGKVGRRRIVRIVRRARIVRIVRPRVDDRLCALDAADIGIPEAHFRIQGFPEGNAHFALKLEPAEMPSPRLRLRFEGNVRGESGREPWGVDTGAVEDLFRRTRQLGARGFSIRVPVRGESYPLLERLDIHHAGHVQQPVGRLAGARAALELDGQDFFHPGAPRAQGLVAVNIEAEPVSAGLPNYEPLADVAAALECEGLEGDFEVSIARNLNAAVDPAEIIDAIGNLTDCEAGEGQRIAINRGLRHRVCIEYPCDAGRTHYVLGSEVARNVLMLGIWIAPESDSKSRNGGGYIRIDRLAEVGAQGSHVHLV